MRASVLAIQAVLLALGADVEAEGLGRFPAALARKPGALGSATGRPQKGRRTGASKQRRCHLADHPMSRRPFDERCRLLAASFTETGSPRTSVHEMLRDRIEMGRLATVLASGAWSPPCQWRRARPPEIAGNGGYGLAGCVWPKPSRPAEKAKGQHPMKKRARPA